MPWIQFSITSNRQQTETIEDCLLLLGACSVTLQDAEDQPLLEPKPGETPLWDEVIVTGLFTHEYDSDYIRIGLMQALGEQLNVCMEYLKDQDWERLWMKRFRPMQFGDKLWICPSWAEPPEPDANNILLDPGLAFGTGTHPTTALCLRWLGAHKPYPSVLDFGCGSGILAIAALKSGSKSAWGVDIDPQALTASRNNANTNGIAEHHFAVTDTQALSDQKFDLVIANILAGPLAELAETLISHCHAGGHIVLSGLLDEQSAEIIQHYQALGCKLLEQHGEEEWALLAFTRSE